MAMPSLRAPIDLLDQSLYEAGGPPYDLFRELRAATPVHWNAMPGDAGVWAITRYKDVFDVSLDQKTFSSHTTRLMRFMRVLRSASLMRHTFKMVSATCSTS